MLSVVNQSFRHEIKPPLILFINKVIAFFIYDKTFEDIF